MYPSRIIEKRIVAETRSVILFTEIWRPCFKRKALCLKNGIMIVFDLLPGKLSRITIVREEFVSFFKVSNEAVK